MVLHRINSFLSIVVWFEGKIAFESNGYQGSIRAQRLNWPLIPKVSLHWEASRLLFSCQRSKHRKLILFLSRLRRQAAGEAACLSNGTVVVIVVIVIIRCRGGPYLPTLHTWTKKVTLIQHGITTLPCQLNTPKLKRSHKFDVALSPSPSNQTRLNSKGCVAYTSPMWHPPLCSVLHLVANLEPIWSPRVLRQILELIPACSSARLRRW